MDKEGHYLGSKVHSILYPIYTTCYLVLQIKCLYATSIVSKLTLFKGNELYLRSVKWQQSTANQVMPATANTELYCYP